MKGTKVCLVHRAHYDDFHPACPICHPKKQGPVGGYVIVTFDLEGRYIMEALVAEPLPDDMPGDRRRQRRRDPKT
jgi:hypothetical protein